MCSIVMSPYSHNLATHEVIIHLNVNPQLKEKNVLFVIINSNTDAIVLYNADTQPYTKI